MEHTNLFLFENQTDFKTKYPNDKVDAPIPGVAHVRASGDDEASTYYNRMVTNYEVTVLSENKSGEEIAKSYTILTPKVLDGNEARVNIIAEDVEGYKPRHKTEKILVSGTGAEHVVVYLAQTSYTITVNHMFSGQSIACATTVEVEDVYEEDVVNVKIEPLSIPGYKAEAVYIWVSGDTTYDLEYEENVYEAVDLGLPSGTLWCDRNVGASSPEGFGGYYAWGEIEEKDTYSYATYRFFNSSDSSYTKYNSTDGKFVLDPEDDVACVEMGGDWHMPTYNQMTELLDFTTSAITVLNGVSGVTLTSKENGNNIFLPFAGGKTDEGEPEPIPEDANILALYTSNGNDETCGIFFVLYYQGRGFVEVNNMPRISGVSIRGVIGDGPTSSPEIPVQPNL